MQPSVIWIGEAEKMFYKKVPKEEKEVFLSKWQLNSVMMQPVSVAVKNMLYVWSDGSQTPKERHAQVSQADQRGGSCCDCGDV